MKACAETFNECVFLENLYIYVYIYIYIYIYIYMYSLAQSQYVIKIDIETQKKHIRLNVSAKAFISMTFQNPTEHTYRFRISKTIHNNSLSGSYLLQCVI